MQTAVPLNWPKGLARLFRCLGKPSAEIILAYNHQHGSASEFPLLFSASLLHQKKKNNRAVIITPVDIIAFKVALQWQQQGSLGTSLELPWRDRHISGSVGLLVYYVYSLIRRGRVIINNKRGIFQPGSWDILKLSRLNPKALLPQRIL